MQIITLIRIQMNKIVNISVIGLGQVGIYLYNELKLKKKKLNLKPEKKSMQQLYQQKIRIKKEDL